MATETPKSFSGFQEDNLALVRLPETFFTEVLPAIDSLKALQLLLYFFWHFEQQQDNLRFLKWVDLTSDPALGQMIGDESVIRDNLNKLVDMGVLLKATPKDNEETHYFINGPQGQAAVDAIVRDEWQTKPLERKPIQLREQQPNIFRLYEENIGPITPMMAEILKEDEKTYPDTWIREAIEIAVTRNVRNWKYIQAVLERWQKEGRGNEQNRRDDSQDPSRYRKSWLGKE